MPNPRLAGRYAKSLLGLALETSQLEQIQSDMLYLEQVCKLSTEFVNLLKSPVIKSDKKLSILNAVTEGKISTTTAGFNRLLVVKGREGLLPEIINAFISQYKSHKGIYPIKLTTATAASEELKAAIVSKVQEQTHMKQVELQTVVDENIIGGFVLDLGGTLVDASIAYDLNKIKSQFMNNDFIYKIR